MPLRIIIQPEAAEDAADAYSWYLRQSAEAAERFQADVRSAIERAAVGPQRYPRHLGGTRRVLLHDFPFAVVFRESADSILVVAVAHASRRPGYWLDR